MAQSSGIAFPSAQVIWKYSSFWRRMFALIIDGILLAILTLPMQAFMPGDASWNLLAVLVGVAYYVYLNGRGATLGKKAMGICVVDGNGNAPGTKRGAIRYIIPGLVSVGFPIAIVGSWTEEIVIATVIFSVILSLLWFYDVMLVIWHPYKQALHDVIARTYVIYD